MQLSRLCLPEISCGKELSQLAAYMNLFKTLTLKWWQTSIFKIGMLTLGIALGAYLRDFFAAYLIPLIIISALSLAYLTYVWLKQ